MGSNISALQPVTPGSLPSSLLPLNKRVKVHLLPKFMTSDAAKFDSKYWMVVKVTAPESTQSGQQERRKLSVDVINAKLTAEIEFEQRKSNLLEDGNSHKRLSRTKSFTLEQSDISVENVKIVPNNSIHISGTFMKGTDDINNKETFELVLCPSQEMQRHTTCNGDWVLMGSLFTRPIDNRHRRHWKAAVRASFD